MYYEPEAADSDKDTRVQAGPLFVQDVARRAETAAHVLLRIGPDVTTVRARRWGWHGR